MIIVQCSIDSLLERTIKHMLYLQSIAKHADKLNKYADVKVNVFSKAYHSIPTVAMQHNHSALRLNIVIHSSPGPS